MHRSVAMLVGEITTVVVAVGGIIIIWVALVVVEERVPSVAVAVAVVGRILATLAVATLVVEIHHRRHHLVQVVCPSRVIRPSLAAWDRSDRAVVRMCLARRWATTIIMVMLERQGPCNDNNHLHKVMSIGHHLLRLLRVFHLRQWTSHSWIG